MELKLQNPAQVKIADLLWNAQTMAEVQSIIRVFGHDARVVYDLMVAATFDEVEDVTQAEQVLRGFRSAGLL
jgi:hypothetical protein